MKTRAAVAWKAGEPLTVETVDLEGPKAGEVLIEIRATGICRTDAYTLSGADPEGIFPAILGHEGAGIVREVGAVRLRADARRQVDPERGDLLKASPLVIAGLDPAIHEAAPRIRV